MENNDAMFQGFTVARCGVIMSIMHRNIKYREVTQHCKNNLIRVVHRLLRGSFLGCHATLPFRLPHDATTSFKPHLLLLSDEPTTLVIFKLDLNYVLINKLTSLRDPFDATKIASRAAISPTAVQIIPFLLLVK